MKRLLLAIGMCVGLVHCSQITHAQTLTFLLRNGEVIAGPKFRYEVWIRSSDGTSGMGSILIYNNYNTSAFGSSVAANGKVTVTKNATAFPFFYGQNATNDNMSSRFGYSWTYPQGAGGFGTVIPSTGDGVLAFTVEIDIADPNESAAISFQGSLMQNQQYLDDETALWNIDVSSTLDSPLPIQLSSLTAIVANQNEVLVEWTTLTETNNYGFEVQKSGDTTNDYQTLPNSFVPGHGTTVQPHSYSYTDATASSGLWFYRLKQIDLDGTEHYSEGVQVDLATSVAEKPIPTVFGLDQNYPNPFNPSTMIEFAIPQQSHVKLEVYNMIGQRVAKLVDGIRSAGYYAVTFDASQLASGVYVYRFEADDPSAGAGQRFVETKKLIFLK